MFVSNRNMMKTILLILSFLVIMPVSAAPQKKQASGVPTLNANAKKHTEKQKKRDSDRPVRPGRYASSASHNELLLRFNSTSSLLSKPYSVAAPVVAPQSQSATPAPQSGFGLYETSEVGRKSATNWGSFSGGTSAEGLMSSGSRYVGNDAGGTTSVNSVSAAPSGPRRIIPDHDEEWWLTPVGDGLVPLALLALAYCAFLMRKRARVRQMDR